MTPNDPWDENKFDVKTLFELEPYWSSVLFLMHTVSNCEDPRNKGREVLCFKWKSTFSGFDKNETNDLLKNLNLEKSLQDGVLESLEVFGKIRNKAWLKKLGIEENPEIIIKISSLSRVFPQVDVDWVKFINDQLLQRSRVTEEDEIMVPRLRLMQVLFSMFMKLDKK